MDSTNHRSDILFTFAVALLLYVAYLGRGVLLLIYVSALFAVVLSPAIDAIRRIHIANHRPGRGAAVLLLAIAGLAAIVLIVVFMAPPILHDVHSLMSDWPSRAAQITERLRHLPFADRLNPSTFEQHLAGALGGVFGIFKGIAGGLFGFFSWLILTSYFILDGERAFRWAMSLFSSAVRPHLESAMFRAERRVRHWLIGQALLMLILGVAATITFGLLRIKYFYALGLLAGALNIVPVVGPLVSVTLAALVATFDSWGKLAGVLIFYAAYQQVENAYLTPRIMKASVDLSPLAVIIALAIGGALAGVLGALVAVPTAAWVAVLIDEYLVDRRAHEMSSTT